jgi:hypothetical protein
MKLNENFRKSLKKRSYFVEIIVRFITANAVNLLHWTLTKTELVDIRYSFLQLINPWHTARTDRMPQLK